MITPRAASALGAEAEDGPVQFMSPTEAAVNTVAFVPEEFYGLALDEARQKERQQSEDKNWSPEDMSRDEIQRALKAKPEWAKDPEFWQWMYDAGVYNPTAFKAWMDHSGATSLWPEFERKFKDEGVEFDPQVKNDKSSADDPHYWGTQFFGEMYNDSSALPSIRGAGSVRERLKQSGSKLTVDQVLDVFSGQMYNDTIANAVRDLGRRLTPRELQALRNVVERRLKMIREGQ